MPTGGLGHRGGGRARAAVPFDSRPAGLAALMREEFGPLGTLEEASCEEADALEALLVAGTEGATSWLSVGGAVLVAAGS